MNLLNRINTYLFIEDKEEYINLNSIKINIKEESNPYLINHIDINIECTFNKDIFNKALSLLKYENLLYESNNGLYNKKDIISNLILYVSKINSNNQLKIIELKNAMINGVNMEENIIILTCDYYIRFNEFLEIDDKEYLYDIYNLININYNKTYNTPYYHDMYFDHSNTKIVENDNEYYEENYDDWNDYDEYQEDNDENEDIFEKSSKLVSKIFSSFYK